MGYIGQVQWLPIFVCLLQLVSLLPRPIIDLSVFRCPCGFHPKACLVMLLCGFLRVRPYLFQLRVLIVVFIGCCLVILPKSALLILSGHLIPRMCLRHLFTKTWTVTVKILIFDISRENVTIFDK